MVYQAPTAVEGVNAEPAATKADFAASPFPQLTRYLSLVAQATSLATIIGFVSAIIINSIIFYRWGLVFLQIASAWDVILSGLQMAVFTLLPVIGAPIGWIVGLRMFRWSRKKLWRRTLSTYSAILYVITLATPLYFNSPTWASIFISSIGLMFFVSVMTEHIRYDEHSMGLNATVAVRLMSFIAFVTVISGSLATAITQVTQTGMIGYGTVELSAPNLPGCENPRAIWIGERAVVVKCGDRRTVVVVGSENVILELATPPG